jgi:hypothetical protein
MRKHSLHSKGRAGRTLLLLSALALGCFPDDSPHATSLEAGVPGGALAFSGCAAVLTGPRCEITPEHHTLTLWLPGSSEVRVFAGGEPVPVDGLEAVEGGTRLSVRVPLAASDLRVERTQTRQALRLLLHRGADSALLQRVLRLRDRGDLAAARQQLEGGLGSLPPPQRERARAVLARIALAEGEYAVAARELRASAEAAYRRGVLSDALHDATALAYVLSSHLHEYMEARAVLARAGKLTADDPMSQALLPHYEGLIALETGDVRRALRQFREAARRASQLGQVKHALLSRQSETTALAVLGRHAEALAAQRRVVADFPTTDPCRAVDVREQLIWLGILARLRPTDSDWPEIERAREEAQSLLGDCSNPWHQRNHRVNAGLLAFHANDLAGARAALDALTRLQGGDDIALRAWELELRGRLALAERRGDDARDAFERELVLGRSAGLWDNEHLAALGLGQSLELLADVTGAEAAYVHAEDLVGRLFVGIPLDEGLHGFLQERELGAQRLVALLVRAHKPREALAVARRARARLLRALSYASRLEALSAEDRRRWERAVAHYRQERSSLEQHKAESWTLAEDQLAPFERELAERQRTTLEALDGVHEVLQKASPGVHELGEESHHVPTWTLFPLPDRVLAFFERGGAVQVEELPRPPGLASALERQAAAWLGPVADAQPAGSALRLAVHGALSTLDLHALPLRRQPLAHWFALAYGVDAPLRTHTREGQGTLVVADPTSDLPNAAREGELVREALGLPEAALLRQRAATREAVLERLQQAAVFHYAGHGQRLGLEGLESGLRLSDGELSLGDILALGSVPRLVVLSACEGAAPAGAQPAQGTNLAEAFLAAGAEAVIAATRPTADQTAALLFAAFYRHYPAATPAAALRLAQRELQRDYPDADWASFRLLVR